MRKTKLQRLAADLNNNGEITVGQAMARYDFPTVNAVERAISRLRATGRNIVVGKTVTGRTQYSNV